MKLIACCEWFTNLTSAPKEEGFSLIPVVWGDKRFFALQALMNVPEPGAATERSARSKRFELVLRHCPYCGGAFEKLIAEQGAAFEEAAEFRRL